jgi:hypothetical protein
MALPKPLPLGLRLLGGPVAGGGLPDVYFLLAGGVDGTVPLGELPDEYFLPDGDVTDAGGEDFGCEEEDEPDEYDLPPLPDAFGDED